MRFFIVGLTLGVSLLAGCGGGGSFRGGVFRKPEVTYRVQPPGSSWQMEKFAGNDLAWADARGRIIAVNSECKDTGDPSLKVLTDHLLLGFDEREIIEREEFHLDGRGALRTHATTSLDGVPVELELTVLKKDGCVYDLIYTSPEGEFAGKIDEYRSLVRSFHAIARRT